MSPWELALYLAGWVVVALVVMGGVLLVIALGYLGRLVLLAAAATLREWLAQFAKKPDPGEVKPDA